MVTLAYPARTVADLIVSQPSGEVVSQRKLLPTRGYWIGREPSCDVAIDEPTVARRHAFVFCANGRWLVCDAGSVGGLDTEAGAVRCAPLSADHWTSIGGLYLWLANHPAKAPDWIDAHPIAGEGDRPTNFVRMSIEDLGTGQFGDVAEVLTVADSSGNIHLCADLSGASSAGGGGAARITVGRANSMDLQICHPSVDPLHCVLALGSERWSLVDAGSRRGIIWEGKRWFRKRLEHGITVPVGDFRLSVQRVIRTVPPSAPIAAATRAGAPAPGQAPGQPPAHAPRRPSAFLESDGSVD